MALRAPTISKMCQFDVNISHLQKNHRTTIFIANTTTGALDWCPIQEVIFRKNALFILINNLQPSTRQWSRTIHFRTRLKSLYQTYQPQKHIQAASTQANGHHLPSPFDTNLREMLVNALIIRSSVVNLSNLIQHTEKNV